mmetsp:Transcript_48904/g.97226  ORF Transcript_48904/g.97226 Transcript_48904/m.97226 type:complete len:278 (-) Transcript_48904:59-892(-)
MGFVDRTDEFVQILQELTAKGVVPGPAAANAPPPQAQSELNAWSAQIGSEIHAASLKVQDLRKKAKKKSIFDDKSSEINEITSNVKQEIQSLGGKIEALEKKVKGSGPNRNYQAHSTNMVDTLKTRLMEVTKDFKDALENRTKALQHQDKRKNLYGGSLGPTPIGNSDDLEGGGSSGMQGLTQAQGYHSSRAEAVQSVQRTIGELAQMFSKMAVMVTAQEEMIKRIDHDLDDTLSNVDAAQGHLLKYWDQISSNRGLIIKVFLILVFFVVFFVVFLA